MLLTDDIIQGFQDLLLQHDFNDLVGCYCDAVVEKDTDFLTKMSVGLRWGANHPVKELALLHHEEKALTGC